MGDIDTDDLQHFAPNSQAFLHACVAFKNEKAALTLLRAGWSNFRCPAKDKPNSWEEKGGYEVKGIRYNEYEGIEYDDGTYYYWTWDDGTEWEEICNVGELAAKEDATDSVSLLISEGHAAAEKKAAAEKRAALDA